MGTRCTNRTVRAAVLVGPWLAVLLTARVAVAQSSRSGAERAARVLLSEDFDRPAAGWVGGPSKLTTTCRREAGVSFLHMTWQQAPGKAYLFYKLPSPPEEGVILRVRLRLTVPARYVAVGWLDTKGRFEHVKLRHTAQGRWETVVVRNGSVLGWLNGMSADGAAASPRTLRILVTGLREPNGALDIDRVELLKASASACDPARWSCDADGSAGAVRPVDAAGLRALHAALRSWSPAVDVRRAQRYRKEGVYQFVYPGRAVRPPAGWDGATPPSSNPTYKFLWHALDPVHFLLRAWWETGDEWYLAQAAEHADRWLGHYLEQDHLVGDKYTWYDHATAYRAIELTALYRALADRAAYAALRAKLRRALCLHAELLSSPGFVARNQPMRYHNHAVYQGLALVVLGAYVPDLPAGGSLENLGLERIETQLGHLVDREGVVVENALGYQLGMLRLGQAVADFLHASGLRRSVVEEDVERMRRFVATVAYPDGTLPAYGDTWYGTAAGASISKRRSIPALAVFADGGYAVLGGGNHLQVNFFTSAKTITHKHEDYLGVTCYWGRRWLIDPGYFDFSDNAHAGAARLATAHNVPLLPDYAYRVRPGAARITGWGQTAAARWVAGEHTAQAGFVVGRRVAVLKDRPVVFLEDRVLQAAKPHARFDVWFHAAPDLALTMAADGGVVLSAASGGPLRCRVVPLMPAGVGVAVFRGQSRPEPIGWCYPGFAQAHPASAWRFSGSADETAVTAVVFEDCSAGGAVSPDREALLEQWREIEPSLRGGATPGE